MPTYNTEAITLRRRRTRDADALVTLWTQNYGKIVVSTRGVIKTSSRYAGVTQPFNRLHVVLYAKNEDQDIWTLTQASLIESYESIQSDINRMSLASNLVEWIDVLSGEFQSSKRIWRLLNDVLSRWNGRAPNEEELLYYQLHLLTGAGLQPQIGRCQKCHKERSARWFHIAHTGGFFCDSCETHGTAISGGTLEILRRFSESSHPPAAFRLSGQQKDEMKKILQNHSAYHAGLQSRASHFQQQFQNHSQTGSPVKEGTPK